MQYGPQGKAWNAKQGTWPLSRGCWGRWCLWIALFVLVPQHGSWSLTLTSRWAMFRLCRNWMAVPISRMISAASADTDRGGGHGCHSRVRQPRGPLPITPLWRAQDGALLPPRTPLQTPTLVPLVSSGDAPSSAAGWHQEALRPPSQAHGESISDKLPQTHRTPWGKNTLPTTLVQVGKLRHREGQGLVQHHKETLCAPSQPKLPMQRHIRTSFSESLVTTLLNPAEQLTTFHAVRESGDRRGESGVDLPLPQVMGPGLQPCCCSPGGRSLSASPCLEEPCMWWAVGWGGLNSTLQTRGRSSPGSIYVPRDTVLIWQPHLYPSLPR